jgi:hypothetical protein
MQQDEEFTLESQEIKNVFISLFNDRLEPTVNNNVTTGSIRTSTMKDNRTT